MANVVGSATIRIIPDSSGFSAALQGQLNGLSSQLGNLGGKNITGNLSTQLNTLGSSLERAGNRAALVGQAFTYGLTRPLIRAGQAIIGVAADFDEAARIVGAVTIPDPVAGQFETMDQFEDRVSVYKQSARDMAKTTVFSSVEIEKAYVDLARAGLTTSDQLESVIGTVANVALVEGGEMADFSDKLVQIFTGFGGNFNEIGAQYKTIFGDVRATTGDLTAEFEHMGDILALVSQRTVTDITDLAVAFRYAGPTAKAAGVSFEEAAAGLGLLAQAGFSGSMGGTALRGIITRLAIPTKLSTEIFEKFGMTMETAFQPENAAKLQDSLNALGASQEDIDEVMAGGVKGFNDAQAAVKGYGFQVFDAAGNMKPLVDIVQEFVDKGARVGDIGKVFGQRAGPAFQGLMDNVGALRALTVQLDGAEGALDRMAERMKTSATIQFKLLKNSLVELAIAFGESGVLKFFAELSNRLRDFVMGLAESNPQILKFVGVAAALVAAIGPVGLIFGLWTKGLGSLIKLVAFAMTGWGVFTFAVLALGAAFAVMVVKSEWLRHALANVSDAVIRVMGPIKELFLTVFGGAAAAAGDTFSTLTLQVAQFFNELAISINEFGSGGGLRTVILTIIDKIEAFKEAWRTAAELFNKAKPGFQETFNQIKETATAAFSLIIKVVAEVWDGLWRLGKVVLPFLAAAFYGLWRATLGGLGLLTKLFNVLEPIASIISEVLAPALLTLAQIMLLARMSGFRFLEWFRAAKAEVPAAAGMFRTFFSSLRTAFGDMFSFLNQSQGQAAGGLFSSIMNALAGLVRGVAAIVQPFTNALSGIVGGVGRFFTFLDNQLRNGGLTGMLFRHIIDPITFALLGALNKVRAAASRIGGAINEGILRSFIFVTSTLPALGARLGSALGSALSGAMSAAGGAISAISGGIGNILNRAFTSLTNLNSGAIGGAIDRALMSVRLNVAGISAVIGRSLTAAFIGAQSALQAAAASLWNTLVTSAAAGLSRLQSFLTTTLPAAFGAAWASIKSNAAAAMIAVIMNVQMAATTIKNAFLGAVDGVVGAWMGMRGRLASIDIGAIFNRVRDSILGIPAAIRAFADSMQQAGNRSGASMDGLWARIKSGAAAAFASMKVTAVGAAQAVGTAFQFAGQAAMGFMQGMMLAEATDLKGVLSSLIPVIISIGTTMAMAITVVNGVMSINPIFAMIAAVQALAVIAGAVFSSMNKEVKDLTDSVDGFRSAMAEAGEEEALKGILDEVEGALDKIGSNVEGQTGFVTVKKNMESAGLSMDDFVTALSKGDQATTDFIKKWREADIDRQISGGFFKLNEVRGKIQVVDQQTHRLVGTFNDVAAAREALGKKFDERFDIQAIQSLITDFKTGKVSLEEYRKTLADLGITEEEAEAATKGLAEEQKTLGQVIQESTQALSTYREELRATLQGIDPSHDLQKARDAFVGNFNSMASSLDGLDDVKNNIDWTIPGADNMSQQALTFRASLDTLSDGFYNQAFAAGVSAKSSEEFAGKIGEYRQQLVDMFTAQGALPEQAGILADKIMETSGVKKLEWSTNFGEVSGQIDDLAAKSAALNMTVAESEAGARAQIAAMSPQLSAADQEFIYAFSGGGAQFRADARAKAGVSGAGAVPTIQAPGGAQIGPNAVAGMPSQGVPSEVTVKIIFSAIENMAAVLGEINTFAESVKTKVAEVSLALLGLAVGTVQTIDAAVKTITVLPETMSAVASMAGGILLSIGVGVQTVVGLVAQGLAALPAQALDATAQVALAFSGMGSSVVNTLIAMSSAVVAVFGSLIQYILFTFSALDAYVLQTVGSITGAFTIMANTSVVASMVVVSAINTIVAALMQIPVIMESVGTSIARGFSRPFNLIATAVWNPFANFMNSAAAALGLGPLLPSGLSIPVFHKGGMVGDSNGDSYDGSRPTTRDEMFALLQKGEGVMSRQMMANMTASQISEFKKGNQRWWAVGGPYESGKGQAGRRIEGGYSFSSPDMPNYDQTKAMWEGGIKPLVGSVRAFFPNSMSANVSTGAMDRIGDAAVDYTRGYTDRMTEEQRAYLTSIGLPPNFNIKGALPAGFDLNHWRSFLGGNKAPGDWPLLLSYLNAAGVPYLVNSTVRPGDGTSYHASGRAVDFGAPGDANYDSPGLLRINHALAPLLGVLAELIYSGPGGISDKAYDAATMAAHHNHVHAALRDGGIIQDLVYGMLGEDGPEVVIPLNDPARALSLARRSGLIKTLQDAQGRSPSPAYTAPSRNAGPNGAIDAGYGDDGILGGQGNTYHIHGISWDQARRKIDNRDQAALRRRR